jgi:chaperonin GroES
MKVKPLGSRVLIKQDTPESKTKSGIIIPEMAQEKINYAIVVETGPGTEKEPMNVKVGDHIMYDKYAGTEVKVNNIPHLIIKTSDIIAFIEND